MEAFDLPEGLILTFDQQETLKIGEKCIRVVPAWRWLYGDGL
jgi:hypothetical protein